MTDRELDALVAEKVMGYKWMANRVKRSDTPRGSIFPIGKDFLVSNPENDEWKRASGERAEAWDYHVSHFSTVMNSAWFVVERMKENGFPHFSLQMSGDIYGARFLRKTGERPEFSQVSDPARAICLAALMAVGYRA